MIQPVPLLHFTNSGRRGGVAEHILTLLRGLDRQRFRPILVCPARLAEQLAGDLPADVEVQLLELSRPTQWRAAFRLAAVLRGRRVGILHAHTFQASVLVAPIAWLCRVPLVLVTAHGREEAAGFGRRPAWFWERLARLFVKRSIAVSASTAAYVVAHHRAAARNVRVIQNGCPIERFFDREAEGRRLRTELGLSTADPVLLVLGSLVPAKGHRVLLEAMPSILAAFPGAQLVCVGEGRLLSRLRSQAEALQIAERVHFAGYQKNVPAWLALADVCIVPSFEEGLPLAAMESLAAGCPVVATAVDGTPEVILHERTGLTVPAGDASALAGAVRRMLADVELREDLALNGRQWVFEKFSAERQVQRTQDLYAKELDLPAVLVDVVNPHQAAVCEEISRACAGRWGSSLRAAVLAGDLTREEATIVPDGEASRVMGETTCLLVFHQFARIASAAEIQELGKSVHSALFERGILVNIHFRAVRTAFLERLKPGIFAYELMTSGQVVWGDSQILGKIPRFPPHAIPREDAWRLLQEAMLDTLLMSPELPASGQRLSRDLQYLVVRLYLDMAASLLVFAGAYAPTYSQRLERLFSIAYRASSREAWPFSLEHFTQQVAAGAQINLLGAESVCGVDFWETAIQAAHQLWRWELAHLTGVDGETPDELLLQAWIDAEPFKDRLHGWIDLARCGRGWWRRLPAWLRQLPYGSPRYRLYAAASLVLFHLPRALSDGERQYDWSTALNWLPLLSGRKLPAQATWTQVIAEIAWNRRQLARCGCYQARA
jgi:glycosyltransferase involved in cell wall biosynthesis